LTGRVFIIPAVIAALTVAGVVGAGYINVPTLSHVFDPAFDGETATAELIVEGVRCYGTADYLREHIEHLPGLVSMVAYAGKHRVVVEYSEQAVSLDTIIAEIERPVQTEDGLIQYFDVVSRKNM
jgi:hypothetical protein